MSFDVDLTTLGIFYALWLPVFWVIYIALTWGSKFSFGYLLLAIVAQWVPWIALIFLLLLANFSFRKQHSR